MVVLIFIVGIVVTTLVGAAMILLTPLGAQRAERANGEDPVGGD